MVVAVLLAVVVVVVVVVVADVDVVDPLVVAMPQKKLFAENVDC